MLLYSSFYANECWRHLSMLPNKQSQPLMFRRIHCLHAAAVLLLCVGQLATNNELFLIILQCTSTYVMLWMTYINAKSSIVLASAAGSDLRDIFATERLQTLKRTCRSGLVASGAFTLLLIIYIYFELANGRCTGPVIRPAPSLIMNVTRSDAATKPGFLVHECITVAVTVFSWNLLLVAAIRMAKSTAKIHVHPAEGMCPSGSRKHAFTDGSIIISKSQVYSSPHAQSLRLGDLTIIHACAHTAHYI